MVLEPSPFEIYFNSRQPFKPSLPRNFAAFHEWIVWSLIILSTVYIIADRWSNSYFDQLAVRYENIRWYRLADPARSEASLALEARLNRDLDTFEQYSVHTMWNQTIWQTWRDDGLSEWRSTWRTMNPDWNYVLLLDQVADDWVHQTFAEVPDVINTWENLPKAVLRADLFRYLITYGMGGVYADVDTSCVMPVDYWMPADMWNDPTVHTVMGFEYNDEHHGSQGWYRVVLFVQYEMLSRPLSPAMRQAIVYTIVNIWRAAENQSKTSPQDVDWNFDTVLKTTGPSALTSGCFDNIMQQTGLSTSQIIRQLYGRTKAHKVGGVAVLPPLDWRAGSVSIPAQYFMHHYQGSWV